MGLDIHAIQQQLRAGSLTSKANRSSDSSSNNDNTIDYTQLPTHNFSTQVRVYVLRLGP